jgi:hypothetical protein
MNVYVIVGSSAGALIAGNPVETDEPEGFDKSSADIDPWPTGWPPP